MSETTEKTHEVNGKFAKGWRGGPGRKPKPPHQRAQYLSIVMETCTPDEWRKICQKALASALEGDEQARTWLGNYLIGRPTHSVTLTGPDGGPPVIKIVSAIMMALGDDSESRSKVAKAIRQLELMENDDVIDDQLTLLSPDRKPSGGEVANA